MSGIKEHERNKRGNRHSNIAERNVKQHDISGGKFGSGHQKP